MIYYQPIWLVQAFSWIGEKEIPGARANNFITDCLKTVKLPDRFQNQDETPWCSAFVNKIMGDSGIPGTGIGMARSWLDWGKECPPCYGAIVCLWRKDKDSPFGHVGFLIRQHQDALYIYGGNQSDKVKISVYPRGRLLGYRWPDTI